MLEKTMNENSIMFTRLYRPKLLVSMLIIAYLFFGSWHLTEFVTADEHYWLYERIPQYWSSLADGEWKKTAINDKPGVSLALVSGIGLLFEPDPGSLCRENDEKIMACDSSRAEALLLAFRLPILFFNALILIYLYWIIAKLRDEKTALWTTLFIALSPMLVGISQVANPDALLWSLSTAAFFSFFAALQSPEKKLVLLSGIFLGFAILSKYTASLLIPFFLLSAIFSAMTQNDQESARALQKRNLKQFGLVVSLSALIIALLLPAVWFRPAIFTYLLSGSSDYPLFLIPFILFLVFVADLRWLQGKIFFVLRSIIRQAASRRSLSFVMPWGIFSVILALIAGRFFFPEWRIFERIPFDSKYLTGDVKVFGPEPRLFESILLEMNPLVFSLPAVLLFFFLWYLIRQPFVRPAERKTRVHSILMLLFLPIYIAVLIYMDVLATPRYLIMLYPLLAFFGSLGVIDLLSRCKHFSQKMTIIMIIVGSSCVSLAGTAPYFLNFSNTLLPNRALISDSWGYGGYEAAQYLNQLPDSENLSLWTDYEGVCEFFKGRCMVKQYKLASKQRFDYAVITRRGEILYNPTHSRWQKDGNFNMLAAYQDPDPEWALSIRGKEKNFIKVVRVNSDFRAAIITDIDHCPSREAVSMERMASFLGFAKEREVDFVISLGDNASHRLRRCSDTGDEDVRTIAELLRSVGKPTYLVLGDHDISSSVSSYQSWLDTTGRKSTYFSFNRKGVHVVVLDTVLGGEAMRAPCEQEPVCSSLEKRLADLSELEYEQYKKRYPDSTEFLASEKKLVKKSLTEARADISRTRSFGNRDRGQVLQSQLEWLREDIASSPHERVLVFSDHPLFPFRSSKKVYDIVNGGSVRDILEQSGKKIVAISGEAHLWHEEELNGIRYFIVDEFRKADGSWASITWNDNGFVFEKIVSGYSKAPEE